MIKKALDYLYYAIEVFLNSVPVLAKIFIKFHAPSVKKEIAMVNITESDKILHIGCGAIPYTSIIINKETSSQIVGIDNKERIVNRATEYVKINNFSDRIKIEMGEGDNYDVSGFDVVIISYGVADHDVVLKHVLGSVKGGTRIVLRKSVTEKNEYINSIVKNFSICSKRLLLTQDSVLIVKKDQIL